MSLQAFTGPRFVALQAMVMLSTECVALPAAAGAGAGAGDARGAVAVLGDAWRVATCGQGQQPLRLATVYGSMILHMLAARS
jgi:hypothetical protein